MCIRNLLIAFCLGRFGLATCDNAEQLQGDLLQSVSLCSWLRSSSFICQLLSSELFLYSIYWNQWLSGRAAIENGDRSSPGPVFHPLVHVAVLGHCLLCKDLLLLQVFYRSFSPGLVSTLLYRVQAESSRKRKVSPPACSFEKHLRLLPGPPEELPRGKPISWLN